MTQQLGAVTLLVHDYDDAIAHYCGDLGFDLLEDTDLGGGKRWVRVAPPGSVGACLLLAQAATADQLAAVGNQTGGRVFLFLTTDNFDRDHRRMVAMGIEFEELPREESYGKVAVWRDPFGNRWDLLQLN